MCSRCKATDRVRERVNEALCAAATHEPELRQIAERDNEPQGWDCCDCTESILAREVLDAIEYLTNWSEECDRRAYRKDVTP